MPATPDRITFIQQAFRSAVIEDADVKAAYGLRARASEDPMESFFDNEADAEIVAQARHDLLGKARARFRVTVKGIDEALALDYESGQTPTADFRDARKDRAFPGLIAAIGIDFARQRATLRVWG